ncbi:phosphoglycerate kinase [Desulfovibrio inopinatus]|uniref:phosphoglycerate kinase n=1 Tax=Desulfovibrio inopinatus TaxID=102109 RepID=UPI00040ABDD2|nr:phosphoglycerate kinase [Desulfovibrio inopinatus]
MIRFLDEMDLNGKKLLIRVDYNVPLDGDRITDDHRIRASIPTLTYALEKGAALVLCSHLGKPKGKVVPELSLVPVAKRLESLLGRPVTMASDCLGEQVHSMVEALKPGDVVMLENLRFHEGETKNDDSFAKDVAQGFDLYVCDAFGVSHRPHASVVGFPKYTPACCAGFLLKKEWDYLGGALKDPKRPFLAISGGAKVSSKLGILKNLLGKVDAMIIGGAMANTFLAAQGYDVGKSLVEPDLFDAAKEILDEARQKKVGFYLPVDFVVSTDAGKSLGDMRACGTRPFAAIGADEMAMDVGPASRALFAEVVAMSETIVWNGPVGAFENSAFANGSLALAEAVAESSAVSIVGGGDTDALVHVAGVTEKMSFISTGGGSFMEFMEGKVLPAFAALEEFGK